MQIRDELDVRPGATPGLVMGQHAAWLPLRPGWGLKLPFQWAGRLAKYQKPREATYEAAPVLAQDRALLTWLAAHRMAPPIGDVVYVQTLISEHPGAWWADPCGAWGYEMQDAATLLPGVFSKAKFRELADETGFVVGSEGAWNDLDKPGNVINGYLVDVHRSPWDRLRWTGGESRLLPPAPADTALHADLCRDGQFPPRERAQPYQEYFAGVWFPGEREVVARAHRLGFDPAGSGRGPVLDLGCHTGGFLQHAALLQRAEVPVEEPAWGTRPAPVTPAPLLVGVDASAEYVALARRIARANGFNICYRQLTVDQDAVRLLPWIDGLMPEGPRHLLALSMTKHLDRGERALWEVVDGLRGSDTWMYLESNAIKTDADWPLRDEVVARGGWWQGDSTDRNRRRLYLIGG